MTTEQKAKLFDDIMDYYDTEPHDTENKEIYWDIITGIRIAQVGLHGYLQEQGRDDTRGEIKLSETTLLQFQNTHKLLYPETEK